MTHITAKQIQSLATESAQAGDILMSAICMRALDRDYDRHDLTDAERARVDAMTIEQARETVAKSVR